MNSVTRRLAKHGIYCEAYKTEVSSAAGTTKMRGYRILPGLIGLDMWVVGQGVATIGSNRRPESVNELIDCFGDKPRRKRKCSQCQRRN